MKRTTYIIYIAQSLLNTENIVACIHVVRITNEGLVLCVSLIYYEWIRERNMYFMLYTTIATGKTVTWVILGPQANYYKHSCL